MGAAIEFPNCTVWDLAQFERVIPIAAGLALRNVGLRPMTQVLERNEYVAPISVKGYSSLGRRDRAEISFDQTFALDPVQSLGQRP